MLLSSKIQIAAIILAILAMLGQKTGVLPFSMAFPGFGLSVLVVAALGLVGLIAFIVGLIRSNSGNRSLSLRMFLLGLAPLAVILAMVGPGMSAPPIHDITTDLDNPPEFIAGKAARVDGENSTEFDAEVAAQQREGYPELSAIQSELGQVAAFNRSLEVAAELGWTVVNKDDIEGRIEAYEETAMFGFIDDVVIRVTGTEAGSRIDLRSNSRVGVSDLGANAARIQRFIDAF